jgi:hypothetical protein
MLDAGRDPAMLAKIKELNVEPLSLSREEMTVLVCRDAAVFSRVAKGRTLRSIR